MWPIQGINTKRTVEVYRTFGSTIVRRVKCRSLRRAGSLLQMRRQGKLKKAVNPPEKGNLKDRHEVK
jgi:hypothetical protein